MKTRSRWRERWHSADAGDKRRKLLWVTPEGEQVVLQMKRTVRRVQTRMVQPLDAQERQLLIALLRKLVAGNQAAL